MIEFLGIKMGTETFIFLVLFLIDEILPFIPVKGNSFIDLLQQSIKQLKPFRKEDDKIEDIKREVKGIRDIFKG
jgi:hypothetical protein